MAQKEFGNPDYSVQHRIVTAANAPLLDVPEVVTVVGTGGFGAWAALFAAQAGVTKLILFNPTGMDKRTGQNHDVTGREIAIGPFEAAHEGMSKLDALTEIIGARRPETEVECYATAFDPENDASRLDGVVFNGVSNSEVHGKIWECAASAGLRCYSGMYRGIGFGTTAEYVEEFRIESDAPVWVGSAVMSAALTVHSAFTTPLSYFGEGRQLDIDMVSLRDRVRRGVDQ